MTTSTLKPPSGSPIPSSPLFADIREWKIAARQFMDTAETCARKAMRPGSESFRRRMWRAYELNIMRCPCPETTVAKCGLNGCTLPKGHDGMACDIPSANPEAMPPSSGGRKT